MQILDKLIESADIQIIYSKLSDADTENGETQVWLDFALACKYITQHQYNELYERTEEVAKLLVFMMHNPDKFLLRNEHIS